MNLEKFIKYAVPVFVIAVISRSIEEISFVYYLVPALCLLFIVLLLFGSRFNVQKTIASFSSGVNEKSEINPESGIQDQVSKSRIPYSLLHLTFYIFLLPGIWFLFTTLWSSYPEVSALRALYFILISTGSIAAGILWTRYSSKNILEFLLPANVLAVLLCLFSLLTNIPSNSWTGGHGKGFMGFFGHQNLLASVLLFTVPAVFVKIKDQSKKLKVFFFILLSALGGLNFLVLTLTYSRSAILSLAFGVVVFLIFNRSWKVFVYSFSITAILAIIIFLTPSLNQFTDRIIKKDFPEFYSSRMWMWEPSLRAAVEGGFTGLGYGISEPNIKPGSSGDHYEGERLIREKGNSTLALIEETGLIGLSLFLFPLIVVIVKNKIKLYRSPSLLTTHYSLITAALAAFILHAQFEAWWVGVGSVQLPLFFIYFGLIEEESPGYNH